MKKITLVWQLHEPTGSFQKKLEFTSSVKAYFYIKGFCRELIDMTSTKEHAEKWLRHTEEQQKSSYEFRVFCD